MSNYYYAPTKCLLVHPKFSENSFWNYTDVCRIVGAKYPAAPLGLLTVAGLLPRHWKYKLVDENVRSLRDRDLAWADVVFTGGMLPQQKSTLAVIRRARAQGKPVVLGGPDPTSQPEVYGDADFLVLGEGEVSIPLFLAALKDGETGGRFVSAEKADMTQAAVPRYDLIRFGDYMHVGVQYSRGCPYDCEFCDVIELFGRQPRSKTSSQLLSELQYLYDLGYRGHVDFVDDNFIGNRRNVVETLRAIRDWQEAFNYPFYFSTEASLNLAQDPELLEYMRDCDFRYVFIGIETAEEQVFDKTAKKLSPKNTVSDAVKKISSYGIVVNAGFIMGFDNETPATADNMIACIRETGICMAMVGTLYALPNTRLTRRLQTEGRLLNAGPALQSQNDVDNTTSGLNFIPTRPVEDILRDYARVLETVYSPRDYYARVKKTAFFLQSHAKHKPSFLTWVKTLWSFVKLSVHITFTPRVAFHYWRLLGGFLILDPKTIETAVNLAAMYVHFHKQSRHVIKTVQRRVGSVTPAAT